LFDLMKSSVVLLPLDPDPAPTLASEQPLSAPVLSLSSFTAAMKSESSTYALTALTFVQKSTSVGKTKFTSLGAT
jgi:hypothetical protein